MMLLLPCTCQGMARAEEVQTPVLMAQKSQDNEQYPPGGFRSMLFYAFINTSEVTLYLCLTRCVQAC